METSTIVEIRTKSGNSFDLELPLTVPIERFSPLVLSSLKKLDPQAFGTNGNLKLLLGNGTVLEPKRTLAKYGLWDGSTIYAEVSNTCL